MSRCRSSTGRLFHSRGPATAKLLSHSRVCVRGTAQVWTSADWRCRCPRSVTSWQSSNRYGGARPWRGYNARWQKWLTSHCLHYILAFFILSASCAVPWRHIVSYTLSYIIFLYRTLCTVGLCFVLQFGVTVFSCFLFTFFDMLSVLISRWFSAPRMEHCMSQVDSRFRVGAWGQRGAERWTRLILIFDAAPVWQEFFWSNVTLMPLWGVKCYKAFTEALKLQYNDYV